MCVCVCVSLLFPSLHSPPLSERTLELESRMARCPQYSAAATQSITIRHNDGLQIILPPPPLATTSPANPQAPSSLSAAPGDGRSQRDDLWWTCGWLGFVILNPDGFRRTGSEGANHGSHVTTVAGGCGGGGWLWWWRVVVVVVGGCDGGWDGGSACWLVLMRVEGVGKQLG